MIAASPSNHDAVEPAGSAKSAKGAADPVMRRHCVSTRVSDAEHAQWVAAAAGRQLGRWVRGVVAERLGGVDRALVAEVRKIGVNVNQIARQLNSGRRVDQSMIAALAAAETALWEVHAAVIAGEDKG